MPYEPFSLKDVRAIFEASEGRGMIVGKPNVGHSGERHVSITNARLADRVRDYKQDGLALRTAFIDFKSQVEAAFAVLNDPVNAPALEHFFNRVRQNDPAYEMKNVWLTTPVKMRYGIGDGARTFPCHYFTLILRKEVSLPRQMHIVTFFGTMGPF